MDDSELFPISSLSAEVITTEHFIKIAAMAIMGFVGTCLAILGLITIWRNSYLQGLVKHYLLVDLTNLFLVNFCHLAWAVPSSIWKLNEVLSLVDCLISALALISIVMSYNPKLFLGINRLMALAVDGRYFRNFERLRYFQYFIMLIFPLVAFVLYLIPGCRAKFITDDRYFFWVEPGCGEVLNYYATGFLGYVYLPFNTIIDCTVFFLLHRRIRVFQRERHHQTSQQKADDLRKEYKLAAQMITNLVTGLILNFSVAGFSAFSHSPLSVFIADTALWQFCSIICCFSYAILLRERKSKSRVGRMISNGTSA